MRAPERVSKFVGSWASRREFFRRASAMAIGIALVPSLGRAASGGTGTHTVASVSIVFAGLGVLSGCVVVVAPWLVEWSFTA